MFGISLLSLIKILIINIILSSDNAIVIATVSKQLPEKNQRKAIVWGTTGTIFSLVILAFLATWLLQLPYLQLVAGILLILIARKLFSQNEEKKEVKSQKSIFNAVVTIILANFFVSLDNILGVAAAAKGNYVLLALGLTLSIPIILYGSNFILYLINKWPVINYLGACVIAYTAGDVMLSDIILSSFINNHYWIKIIFPIICVLFVLYIGFRKKGIKSIAKAILVKLQL